MKRTSLLLIGLSVIAFTVVVSTPCSVRAHGGIGGFHAGGFHAGGFHAGGFHAAGFHAGGFHAGGFNHVGYYPHYHPGVGYYHPVARAAVWDTAYNRANYYGGYNPYPYPDGGPSVGVSDNSDDTSIPSDKADVDRAEKAKQKLDAELKADKDKGGQ